MQKANEMSTDHKEIVIIGGGAVGMLMALALSSLDKKITLIEKQSVLQSDKVDNRSIALSYTSVCVLNALGVWQKIEQDVELIKQVHVSDKRGFSQTNLFAKDEGLPFLGCVVKLRHLVPVLFELLQNQMQLEIWQDTEVVDLCEQGDGEFQLLIAKTGQETKVNARLIVAADGAWSKLRTKAGIASTEYDYQQSALVFDIQLQKSHQNIAYERFVHDGVMAMLPVTKKQMACVWSVDREKVAYWHQQSKSTILKEVQRIFSYRLGRFVDIGEISSFPLSLIQAQSLFCKNLLVFGNASHFLHPISGQGLNLSIRDIGILYDLLKQEHHFSHESIENMLAAYQRLRQFDHKRTAMLTHTMLQVFNQSSMPIKLFRGVLLHCLERDQIFKKTFSRLMMGKYNYGSTLAQQVNLCNMR